MKKPKVITYKGSQYLVWADSTEPKPTLYYVPVSYVPLTIYDDILKKYQE